jgi:hypothetical protein
VSIAPGTQAGGYEIVAAIGAGGESETLFREALDGRRRVPGDGHVDTLKTLNNLAVYLVRGKPDEAARWRAKLPPDAASK